ncbi:cytochrome c oxidase assembly protein [Pseudomonas sp. NCHU5208]|uniref:cytochrome c oxidase assembly protein n=1 Tax=unclassified Pseudomonas TaxID=196821 RepID=UPI003F9502B3
MSKVLLALLLVMPAAWGHAPDVRVPGEVQLLSFDPWSWLLLLGSALLYLRGAWRLRRGIGREQWLFIGGWLSLAVALGPPLDPLGGYLFSAHMLQHEILILVSAPLLALSRPGGLLLWGLPGRGRQLFKRLRQRRWLRSSWEVLSSAHGAWLLHAAVLWGWHLPPLFDASVLNDGVHAAQHGSFFLSALLFWWALLQRRQAGAVLYLFTTAVHSSLLGALLSFSPTVWYSPYLATTQTFGLDPVQDQQLGGLIMWIPAGLVFLAAGLLLTARALNDAPRLERSR